MNIYEKQMADAYERLFAAEKKRNWGLGIATVSLLMMFATTENATYANDAQLIMALKTLAPMVGIAAAAYGICFLIDAKRLSKTYGQCFMNCHERMHQQEEQEGDQRKD